MNNIIRFFIYNALFILIGCTDYIEESQRAARIILSAEIKQEAVSRVNDNGFTDGDMMGVYVVDYNSEPKFQRRGLMDVVIFSVTFRVNDPDTNIVLQEGV